MTDILTSGSTPRIVMPALSDYHVHFRQNLSDWLVYCPASAARCGRVQAMPNLVPPIATAAHAVEYAGKLKRHMPEVDVRVAVKLTQVTTTRDIALCAEDEARHVVSAFKLYPDGVTTHSFGGFQAPVLRNPDSHTWLGDLLDCMQSRKLVLCLHGEMPGQPDPLLRESDFLGFVEWVIDRFPRLRVVLEHITTTEAVRFVADRSDRGKRVAATITPHHLYMHLGHVFGSACDDEFMPDVDDGKLHPHHFCWPLAKQPAHRDSLQWAATSGMPCFFLGSDSAPHAIMMKEAACGCAGVWNAPVLAECLAQFFEQRDALDKLTDFATHFGDKFYDLPCAVRTITLRRQSYRVPDHFGPVVPFMAGRTLHWSLAT